MRVHTDWLLTPERAAIHLPTATAVVADLHLGYDRARRRRGEAVPDVDLEDALAPLHALILQHEVRQLAVAGDLFEEGPSPELVHELLAWLAASKLRLLGIAPGNHDRELAMGHAALPIFPDGISLDSWRIVHGHSRVGRGCVVQGHWHPCLRWSEQVVAPCYLVGPRRLILPAFSADAAGVNVLAESRWSPYRCCVIAGRDVLDFGPLRDLPRRTRKRQRRRS